MKAAVFIFLVLVLASCTKEDSKVPENTVITNSNDFVVITGTVSQYNIYGHLSYANLSSIEVKLVGTNLVTNCDASGNFTLTNVPKGTYKIEMNKVGYGVSRGNITLNSNYDCAFAIGEIPQWNLTLGASRDTNQIYAGTMAQGFSFSMTVNTIDSQNRNIQIYYSNRSGINPLNSQSYKARKSCWSNANEVSFTFFTPYSECANFSSSGDTIFYKVCPITYGSSIEDSSLIFTNITSVNTNGPESFFIIP